MSKIRRSAEFKNNSRVIDMDEARAKRQARRKKERAAVEKRSANKRREQESRGKRAIRRKRNRTRLFIALVVMAVLLILTLLGVRVVSLLGEKHDLETQHEALVKEKARLERELANANNKETIEDVAREKLRLIKPGETLYMFPYDFGEDKTDNDKN